MSMQIPNTGSAVPPLIQQLLKMMAMALLTGNSEGKIFK
jgi:hypothetical protein